jgi:hypothetical protein
MNQKSWGGILLVAGLAYWYVSSTESDRARKADIGGALSPVGDVVIETKFKWARTVGHGLKLAGRILEIEYLFADGGRARTTHSLSDGAAKRLKPGDRIVLRDADGFEKECRLDAVEPSSSSPPEQIVVRYSLLTAQTKRLFHADAMRLGGILARTPGVPYWVNLAGPNMYDVTYGPLPFSFDVAFQRFEDASAFANDLRAAAFNVTVAR